jgi:two-component system, LytTR family, response regulator
VSVRVLVADDEAPARRKLRSHLAGRTAVEVAGEAADGLQTVEAIRSLHPDLVFLDIQMPGLSGFEVIETVGVDAMPAVVFVTAYDEFAVEAFEVQAVDYLLKPYSKERFEKALDRALHALERREDSREAISSVLDRVLAGRRPLRRLVVRSGERLLLVPLADVLHLSADGNYVKVHTPGGVHLLRDTLTALEGRLDPERFARIHRGEIVNLDAVKEIQPYFHGDLVVILKNGEHLRLSRRYRDRVLGAGDDTPRD